LKDRSLKPDDDTRIVIRKRIGAALIALRNQGRGAERGVQGWAEGVGARLATRTLIMLRANQPLPEGESNPFIDETPRRLRRIAAIQPKRYELIQIPKGRWARA